MNFQILLGSLIVFAFLFFFTFSFISPTRFFKPPFLLLSSPSSHYPYSLINDSLLELEKLKKDQLYVVNQQ
jgi:hypothetical protein